MRYKGIIKNLEKLVVSDPHYLQDVWCRYEKNFDKKDDWQVSVIIKNETTTEEYEGEKYELKGTSFVMAVTKKDELLMLNDNDVGSFSHYSDRKINKTEIGMDTAQIAMGINNHAQKITDFAIKKEKSEGLDVLDDYRPHFAITTLTDGHFGSVFEGVADDEIKFVVIEGYFDDAAGVSVDDLANYLQEYFEIDKFSKELEKTEELDEVDK